MEKVPPPLKSCFALLKTKYEQDSRIFKRLNLDEICLKCIVLVKTLQKSQNA